jgi:ankyrin repeat protein
MSLRLDAEITAEIQQKYFYLTNYESDDPTDAIDPLTYVDSNGDSLLHIAAQNGDATTIGLLLDAGLDVNQLGDMYSTPLHYAHQGGHQQAIELLLSRGAATDICNAFGKVPGG